MDSYMRDEEIDTQLVSDSSESEGGESQADIKWMVSDSSDSEGGDSHWKQSRKRKASFDVVNDKPAKRLCQPLSTPPSSPVRKTTPRKPAVLSPNVERDSSKKKENLLNRFSPNKALLNNTSKKSPAKSNLTPKKSHSSRSSVKANLWSAKKSSNQRNGSSSADIGPSFQSSDSENEDSNNTRKKNLSPTVIRKLSEGDAPVTNSPGKGKAIFTNEVSVNLVKLQNSLSRKMHHEKTIQELSDLKVPHKEKSFGSPRRSLQKTYDNVTSPLKMGLNSPGKNKTISSHENIISNDDITCNELEIIKPQKNCSSPLKNAQKVKEKVRHLKCELSPTKLKHNSEDTETLTTRLKRSRKCTRMEDDEQNIDDIDLSDLSENKPFEKPVKNTHHFRDRDKSQEDRETKPLASRLKRSKKCTRVGDDDQNIDDIDLSDLSENKQLEKPVKNTHHVRDQDKCQEDKEAEINISSPDRKTNDRNINNCKQLLSPKFNSGSACAAISPKPLTPLHRREITVTTPISNKRKGRTLLTPSMPGKQPVGGVAEGKGEGEDAMDATRRQLHVSTVPRTLPCREPEFDHVRSFLAKKIGHGAGGCMYISGVPGTGKTATVHAVIRFLQEEVDKKELPDFDFVEINGLRLTEPRQAYVRILQSLTDQKRTPEQAQQMLNKRFARKCRKATVILVDELDYLCNRRQDVVYNVLEWGSGGGGSGVVVVAVSNTMDLPERALKGRVTSRMGLTRLAFRPYTHKQLQTIVTERLADHPDAFHPDAVQFVARKVAAVSGDARRALDICRRTTELVQPKEQVTAAHVERALAQIFCGPRVQVIRRLGRLAQTTLRALRDTAARTGIDETTVAHAHRQLASICQLEGIEVPPPGATLAACVSLAGLGLVVAEKRGRPDLLRKICLNVSSDDIHYALDNTGGT